MVTEGLGQKAHHRCNLITCTYIEVPVVDLLYLKEVNQASIEAVRSHAYRNLYRSYALLLSCMTSAACTSKGYW